MIMNNKLTLQLFAFDCNAIPDEQRNHALAAIKKFGKALKETGRQQRVSGVRFTRDQEVRIKNQPLEKVKIQEIVDRAGINKSSYYYHFYSKEEIRYFGKGAYLWWLKVIAEDLEGVEQVAKFAKKRGVSIVNRTKGSFIDSFEYENPDTL